MSEKKRVDQSGSREQLCLQKKHRFSLSSFGDCPYRETSGENRAFCKKIAKAREKCEEIRAISFSPSLMFFFFQVFDDREILTEECKCVGGTGN